MQMIGSSPDAEIYEHNVLTTLIWSCDWSERGCDEALPYRGATARDEGVALRAFSFIFAPRPSNAGEVDSDSETADRSFNKSQA